MAKKESPRWRGLHWKRVYRFLILWMLETSVTIAVSATVLDILSLTCYFDNWIDVHILIYGFNLFSLDFGSCRGALST